jgi:hypothetical protein
MADNLNQKFQNNTGKDNPVPPFGSTMEVAANAANTSSEPLTGHEENLSKANQTTAAYGAVLDQKAKKAKREKPLVMFAVCIALFVVVSSIVVSIGSKSVDTSEAAKEAIRDTTSSKLPIGTLLLSNDEIVGCGDYTITHDTVGQDSTKIWVWDFAAEDGDYVEVLVNGVSTGPAFMIKHKPAMITVSLPGLVGQVQVKGVRDGGGGITYAVHIEFANRTFFNSAPEGEFNTYTFVAGQ